MNEIPERIIIAAAHLFREKGYPNTSVDEIASAIGIKKASIYHYIRSKEELLVAIANTGIQELLRHVEKVPLDLPPSHRLQLILELHCRVLLDATDVAAVALTERRYLPKEAAKEYFYKRDRYREIVEGIIAEGVSVGAFDVDDIKLSTFAILGMINSTLQWFDHEGRSSLDEIATYLARLSVTGILRGSRADNEMTIPTRIQQVPPS